MAKEKHEAKHGKKKHLVGITTHKTDQPGVHVHEHHYRDEDGKESSSYGGVSTDMADLHQHMDDHLAPDAEEAQEGPPGGPGGAPGGGAPPDGGGGPPMAA
jgi:hypothetical protein